MGEGFKRSPALVFVLLSLLLVLFWRWDVICYDAMMGKE